MSDKNGNLKKVLTNLIGCLFPSVVIADGVLLSLEANVSERSVV